MFSTSDGCQVGLYLLCPWLVDAQRRTDSPDGGSVPAVICAANLSAACTWGGSAAGTSSDTCTATGSLPDHSGLAGHQARRPLTAVSRTGETALDSGVRAGHPVDPDLRRRIPTYRPDMPH